MKDELLPDVIEVITELVKGNSRYVTTKQVRKILKISSDDGKLVKKIADALRMLAHYKFLVIEKKYPIRYRIKERFLEDTRDMVRLYRKNLTGC